MPIYNFATTRNNGLAWIPAFRRQVDGVQADQTAAINWVITNASITGYQSGDSIFLEEYSTTEAELRGMVSMATFGNPTDAMAAAGGSGTAQAKLRLMTDQLDTLNTSMNTLNAALVTSNSLNSPYSAIVHQKISLVAGTAVEAKAGVTRLPNRKGVFIENLSTNTIGTIVRFGDVNVANTGVFQGVSLNLGDKIFFPAGDFQLNIIASVNCDVIVMEVA
jgi:hypothetical protein